MTTGYYATHERPPGTILVVDDDKDVAHTMAKALSRQGHEVTRAHGGREALLQAERCRHDIVILDLAMPDVSGLDVLRELAPPRKVGDVIVVSGYGTEELEAEARRLGACLFMPKPMLPTELMAAVDGVLSKQLARRDRPDAAAYIDVHFRSIRCIEEIAAALGITARTTQRQVWRGKGMPALVYLRHRRIEEAKVLLARTDKQVKEIAIEVGCQTATHFSRLFRGVVGLSPSQFRRRNGRQGE